MIAAIENDQILDIVEHPNKQKYGNQKMYVIWVKEYVYLVPFVIDMNGDIFLKTIIPSKKQNENIFRSTDEKKQKIDAKKTRS